MHLLMEYMYAMLFPLFLCVFLNSIKTPNHGHAPPLLHPVCLSASPLPVLLAMRLLYFYTSSPLPVLLDLLLQLLVSLQEGLSRGHVRALLLLRYLLPRGLRPEQEVPRLLLEALQPARLLQSPLALLRLGPHLPQQRLQAAHLLQDGGALRRTAVLFPGRWGEEGGGGGGT